MKKITLTFLSFLSGLFAFTAGQAQDYTWINGKITSKDNEAVDLFDIMPIYDLDHARGCYTDICVEATARQHPVGTPSFSDSLDSIFAESTDISSIPQWI